MNTWEHPALQVRVRQLAEMVATPSGRDAVDHAFPVHGHVNGVYTADGEADPAAVILADLEHLVGSDQLGSVLDLLIRQRVSPEGVRAYLG